MEYLMLKNIGFLGREAFVEEEELEWISNEDSFPMVESLPSTATRNSNSSSPISVLENKSGGMNLSCNFKVPGKARTKDRRRRDMRQGWWWMKKKLGRKCLHCGAEKTPQWRAGPLGPKTLCNACGVRYKSGRLCDEYRPASSPTFSAQLHSNSHRKIVQMVRQKMANNASALNPSNIG